MKNEKYTVQNFYLKIYLRFLDFFFSRFLFKKQSLSNIQYRKVLILQLAHLGDVVLSTSIFPIIKKQYPDANIGLVVGSWAKDLVQDHPLIDEIYYLDHPKNNRGKYSIFKKALTFLLQWLQVSRNLRKELYDASIDLSGFYPNSHVLTFFSKVKNRVGYVSGGGGALLSNGFYWDTEDKHITKRYEKLLGALDIKASNNSFLIPSLQNIQRKRKSKGTNPYVIFHPFSGDKRKDWSYEKWAELLKMVPSSFSVIFTGKGREEEKKIDGLINRSVLAENRANSTSLHELGSLVAGASLVVSTDTAVGHMASAFKVPTLTVFTKHSNSKLWSPPSTLSFPLENPSVSEVFHHMNNILQIRSS